MNEIKTKHTNRHSEYGSYKDLVNDAIHWLARMGTEYAGSFIIRDGVLKGPINQNKFTKEYRHHLPELMRSQDNKCNICSKEPKGIPLMHVDHIYPVSIALSEGWSKERINNITNLQMLCRECNTKKGATI